MVVKLNIKSIVLHLMFLMLIGCIDDQNVNSDFVTNASKPDLGKIIDGRVTASTIELKSEVLKANGYPIIERGFSIRTDSIFVEGKDSLVKVPLEEGVGPFSCLITGLKGDTKYYIHSFAKNKAGINYGVQDTFRTYDGLGKVLTYIVESGHAKTAKVSGKIIQQSEGEVIRKGIYFSKYSNMAEKDSMISLIEADSFVCNFIDLEPSTSYYLKAFVTTKEFGTFSDQNTLVLTTTSGLAKVDTVYANYIESYSVDLFSNILDLGDSPVLSYGFCWSETPNPTIENSNKTILNNGRVGPFVGFMDKLYARKTYYVRAYATNSFGTAYGKEAEITTISELPTLKTLDPQVNSKNGTIELDGQILHSGHSNILTTGFCFSYSISEPTILNSDTVKADYKNDFFNKKISGLKGGVSYYVRAYATNSEGTAYGTIKKFETPSQFSTGLAVFPKSPMEGSSAYFVIGNKGYILGGDIGPHFSDELWSYDPLTDNWSQYRSFPGGEYKWQSAVSYKSYAYILGGVNNSYDAKDDFYRYDSNPSMNKWEKMTNGPDAAFSRVGFSIGDNIYYIGGKKDTVNNEVWSYSINQDAWSQEKEFPVKQYGGVAININGVIYAGLGKNMSNECNKKLWKSSNGLANWSEEFICQGISGGVRGGAVFNDKIYVIDEAGYIFEFNPSTSKWYTKSQVPAAYRDLIQCMFVLNDQIYIGLGNKKLIIYNPLWDN